jgi:hypothetical protein
MVDFQSRLISPCRRFDAGGTQTIPDIPAILRRLLLFDTYILQTNNFNEFVPLIRTLGIDNVVTLLDSGSLQIGLGAPPIAQIGQMPDGPTYTTGKPPLPLLSFSFSHLLFPHPNEFLLRRLADLRRELYGYVGHGDLMRLEGAILRAVNPVRDDAGEMAVEGQRADLRSNSPVLRKALAMTLRRGRGIDAPESEIALRVIAIDDTDFRVETNLSKFGLGTEEQHKTVESALLANGGLNSRIVEMRSYEALSGAIDDELSLFAGKFDFLASTLSPTNQEETFERVIKVRKLPSLDLTQPDRSFDMHHFLDIRTSKECREFRSWLRRMGTASDEEILEQINTVRAKLGPLVHGSTGKGIRIAISTVIGSIPGIGTIAGLLLSGVDSYLLESLFPVSGPTLFLSRQYRSLFTERNAQD